jgi:hypothetical protein
MEGKNANTDNGSKTTHKTRKRICSNVLSMVIGCNLTGILGSGIVVVVAESVFAVNGSAGESVESGVFLEGTEAVSRRGVKPVEKLPCRIFFFGELGTSASKCREDSSV